MAIAESSTVAVSYVGVGAGGGEQSPPISLQNETNATPAAPNTPGGDPGLTVLQPPVSQPQVASAIPPYSTMLPSFGHYATGEYNRETTACLIVCQGQARSYTLRGLIRTRRYVRRVSQSSFSEER